ncbi:MAG: hypothetical protein EAX96_14425 [Candidatus Lokiarchaeota archaeon]|nr:hypothetical protein [Candidatus Lokiarchaeota archaeon]
MGRRTLHFKVLKIEREKVILEIDKLYFSFLENEETWICAGKRGDIRVPITAQNIDTIINQVEIKIQDVIFDLTEGEGDGVVIWDERNIFDGFIATHIEKEYDFYERRGLTFL